MFLKLHDLLEDAVHFTRLPGKKDEKWRFSPLRNYLEKEYKRISSVEKEALRITPKQKYWLYLKDGQLVDHTLPESVHIRQHAPAFEMDDNPFACLSSNTALSSIELRCYEDIEFGLYLFYSSESFITSSLNIIIKEGIKASAYLCYEGGANSFISHASHIKLYKQGRLELVQNQKLSLKAAFITHNSLHLERKASYKGFSLLTGGEYLHNFIQADLHYQSEIEITSLLLSKHRQKAIFSCDINHLADSSKSNVLSKQVLKDESVCVFDANTCIVSDTKATKAKQASHALLLSRQAQVHAKPHLKIYSDDLSASHGTTVGELDQDAISYLTSRGIQEAKAVSMLTSAFIDETIETIDNVRMKEHIFAAIGEHYAKL